MQDITIQVHRGEWGWGWWEQGGWGWWEQGGGGGGGGLCHLNGTKIVQSCTAVFMNLACKVETVDAQRLHNNSISKFAHQVHETIQVNLYHWEQRPNSVASC